MKKICSRCGPIIIGVVVACALAFADPVDDYDADIADVNGTSVAVADTDTDTDKLSADTTRADSLKAGFDPLVVGCCFAVMALVALWQRRRAFGRDMAVYANTCVGEMVLPAPVIFGWGMGSSAKEKVKENELKLEEFDEGDPSWREPFRASYLELYHEMFADLAHNPALLQRLYEKSLRAHRRDADIIEKAYREAIRFQN